MTGIVFAIITLAIVVGLGITIMQKMGDTTVLCSEEITNTTVLAEAGSINGTGYSLALRTAQNFSHYAIIGIVNTTSGLDVLKTNYTLTGYTLYNNSQGVFSAVLINYTYIWTDSHRWNATSQQCMNVTNGDGLTGTGTAYTGLAYAATQIGSTGLLAWLPAIIALLIGMFFLLYFMGGKKKY